MLGHSVEDSGVIQRIQDLLEADRQERAGLADEPLMLNADDSLSAAISHLRGIVLPAAAADANSL